MQEAEKMQAQTLKDAIRVFDPRKTLFVLSILESMDYHAR